MTEPLAGGCACGAIRYRLSRPPMFVNCCHCRECQRHTGSAFVINAVIETASIALLEGNPTPTQAPTASGGLHDIYRCPVCQTALWSDYGRRSTTRFVRVATLDSPEALPPDAHIFTATRLPWVGLPPETPAFEAFYDLQAQWPPDGIARLKAAKA